MVDYRTRVETICCCDGGEKVVRDVDRDIEVNEGVLIILGVDIPESVWVGDSHHSHIRAAANSTLFHDIGYLTMFMKETGPEAVPCLRLTVGPAWRSDS